MQGFRHRKEAFLVELLQAEPRPLGLCHRELADKPCETEQESVGCPLAGLDEQVQFGVRGRHRTLAGGEQLLSEHAGFDGAGKFGLILSRHPVRGGCGHVTTVERAGSRSER